jgi:hypothetical protein
MVALGRDRGMVALGRDRGMVALGRDRGMVALWRGSCFSDPEAAPVACTCGCRLPAKCDPRGVVGR